MKAKLKIRNRGFTIIEVLIVLAIAGLILLIVFLAVPALQRSARNTQRKNDAAAVGGAIANYISDNGGSLPTVLGLDATDATSTEDICGAGGGAVGGTTACTGNIETAKLGFYTPKNISINTVAVLTTPVPTANTMIIEAGEDCNSSNTKAGSLNSRTAAIFYATETGSSVINTQCVEQ